MNQNVSKTKKPRASIKWKIFGYFTIFSVGIMIILWIFQIVLLESFYKAIMTSNMKMSVESISKSLISEQYEEQIKDISVKNNLSVKIINCNTFETVLSLHPDISGSVLHSLRNSELYILYDLTKDNGGESVQTYQLVPSHKSNALSQNAKEEESFLRGKPPFFLFGITQTLLITKIVSINNTPYMIMADSVITPIDSTVSTLRMQLVCVSILALIFSLVLVTIISKRISKPIMNINESAKKLAAGKYDEHFDGTGYLEIEQLSETLNITATELKKAESLQHELIANTSHDLRTPLTMIIGYGEVIRDVPGENTPENIQVIIDEATRLTHLVNDLLDISKLQSGTDELKYSEFNFTVFVRDIISRYTKLVENDGFKISFFSTSEVYVRADSAKIEQVIYNLLSNAVHYAGKDKKITVNQIISEDKVRLEISDTGEGIREEDLPYIWDRYYKIDKSHIRTSVGSGLGLSIVKSILELHKEKYGVISTYTKGSTFWFELQKLG